MWDIVVDYSNFVNHATCALKIQSRYGYENFICPNLLDKSLNNNEIPVSNHCFVYIKYSSRLELNYVVFTKDRMLCVALEFIKDIAFYKS